jgi:glycine oxidase
MKHSANILIIGGGIIGCSIAYHLRKLNITVTVLDQGEIGAQASSAAAGLLAPLGPLSGPGPLADLVLASFSLFPSLVPELEDASGIHVEYQHTGALRIVRNPKRITNLHKRMQAWQPLGLQMHWLTGDEARQREPLLAPDTCAAIYAPEESQLSAPLLTRAYAQAALTLGATLLSNTTIIGIQRHNASITAATTSIGETIPCDHLIIATGAWAAQSSNWLDFPIPVTPQRGQILSLKQPSPPSPPLRHIIFGEAAYLAPKAGNTIIVGATKEDAGFDIYITASGIAWLLNTAINLTPALQHSPLKATWAGLRPKTPDTQPILGPAPTWDNVTLATGHNSIGILLSAITGQTIAELVATGQTPKLIHPFLPDRIYKQGEINHVPTQPYIR